MLGEPPPSQGDLHFSVFGIPVRVHPFFWIITLLLGAQNGDATSVLTWVLAVFVAILVHELGHAAVLRAYGFRPWIVLYGMGGLACHDERQNPRSKGSEPLGQILISLAGPVAGFLLAALLVGGLVLAGHGKGLEFFLPFGLPQIDGVPNARIGRLINDLFFICVVWGEVNLLPIYPLDGGQIAREIFVKFGGGAGIRQSLLLSTFAAGLMAAFGLLQWQSLFIAVFFGYMAYASYMALEAYRNRGPW